MRELAGVPRRDSCGRFPSRFGINSTSQIRAHGADGPIASSAVLESLEVEVEAVSECRIHWVACNFNRSPMSARLHSRPWPPPIDPCTGRGTPPAPSLITSGMMMWKSIPIRLKGKSASGSRTQREFLATAAPRRWRASQVRPGNSHPTQITTTRDCSFGKTIRTPIIGTGRRRETCRDRISLRRCETLVASSLYCLSERRESQC